MSELTNFVMQELTEKSARSSNSAPVFDQRHCVVVEQKDKRTVQNRVRMYDSLIV